MGDAPLMFDNMAEIDIDPTDGSQIFVEQEDHPTLTPTPVIQLVQLQSRCGSTSIGATGR